MLVAAAPNQAIPAERGSLKLCEVALQGIHGHEAGAGRTGRLYFQAGIDVQVAQPAALGPSPRASVSLLSTRARRDLTLSHTSRVVGERRGGGQALLLRSRAVRAYAALGTV